MSDTVREDHLALISNAIGFRHIDVTENETTPQKEGRRIRIDIDCY